MTDPNIPKIIPPTIGRRVWFRPQGDTLAALRVFDESQACDAGVTYVWSDRMVNLSVTGPDGVILQVNSVTLVQPGDAVPGGNYAEWMPYQVGQAKKHEEKLNA